MFNGLSISVMIPHCFSYWCFAVCLVLSVNLAMSRTKLKEEENGTEDVHCDRLDSCTFSWLAGADLVYIRVAKGGLAELKPKVQNVTSIPCKQSSFLFNRFYLGMLSLGKLARVPKTITPVL